MSQYPQEQLYTQRVYIDPQRLLKLKKQRKTFKHVPSIFEPPPEPNELTTRQTPPQSLHSYKPSNLSDHKPHEVIGNQLMGRSNSANVDFVLSLLGQIKAEQIIQFEQGDCFEVRVDSRCLVLQGTVKVTGVGGRSFSLSEGSILFINVETIQKIKEIICTRPTKIIRISQDLFSMLRNYIFLKNSQKIKYLRYCPFFLWSEILSEDIASFMTMETYEKNFSVYQRGDNADNIYFVKEGVVLLQRNQQLNSMLFGQYETHYQRSELSPQQTTLVVKKGMVFGIDGILLRDSDISMTKVQGQNPESKMYEPRIKNSCRVYTARTIGRTQIYVLKRQILEGLFDIADLLSARNFPRELSKQDLQRISSEYADMVVRHRSLPRLSQTVSTKQIILSHQTDALAEEIQKRDRVRQIRLKEEKIKKNSIGKIIADNKEKNREKQLNGSMVLQQYFSKKLGMSDPQIERNNAFPRLSSNMRKKRVLKKDPKIQQAQKYVMGWLKCKDPFKAKQRQASHVHKTPKQTRDGKERLSLINVRSYRSIISLV